MNIRPFLMTLQVLLIIICTVFSVPPSIYAFDSEILLAVMILCILGFKLRGGKF